jgi:hypothetical protein
VHHRVADVQLRQVLDQRLDVADLLLLLAAARGGRAGEQLGLGDEVDRFLDPARSRSARRRGGDAQLLVAGLELLQRLEGRRRETWLARRKSSRLSRRPALSASTSTRWACGARAA